jgi:hypothetical protein
MLEADIVRAAIFPLMLAGAIYIWRSGRRVAGRLLVLIGVLHLSGLWVGREPLRRIAEGGFFNQVDSAVGKLPSYADQELVFWFALWGLLMVLIGQLLIVLEGRGVRAPAWFGVELLVLNLGCAFLLPKGGFWWVLLPAYRIIRPARDRAVEAGT